MELPFSKQTSFPKVLNATCYVNKNAEFIVFNFMSPTEVKAFQASEVWKK